MKATTKTSKSVKNSKPANKTTAVEEVKSTAKLASPDEKATCAICGLTGHVLINHIKVEHSMSPADYVAKYDAPLFSAVGADLIKKRVAQASGSADDENAAGRSSMMQTVEKLFGWEKEAYEVEVFEAGKLTPTGNDDSFVYPYQPTLALLFALHRDRPSCYIQGYSGTGKTQLVLNVARKLGREVIRLNLDSSLTRADIIGDWTLRGGEPVFNYGPLPRAMKRGAILLLDEFDLVNSYVAPLFRPILEDNPSLCIAENGGEVIIPAPGFAVIATCNTWGTGDQTGLYGNTQTLSLADRQRFGLFIEVEYLDEKDEVKLLTGKVPGLEESEAQQFVQVAARIRKLYREGKIEEAVSPRQLVNWGEVFVSIGNAARAADMAWLMPLQESTRLAVRQLIEESGIKPRS